MYMYTHSGQGCKITFLPTGPKHQNLLHLYNEPNSKFYVPNRKFTSHRLVGWCYIVGTTELK